MGLLVYNRRRSNIGQHSVENIKGLATPLAEN